MVTLSQIGSDLIAKFEGLSLKLYNDPSNNCTIAIGHMVHSGPCNGSEPQAFKDGITTQQAYDLLRTDAQHAADCVASHVTVPLSQPQIDALISFVFNVGCGAFQSSDLLTELNQSNYAAVPAQLMRWVHGGGVVLPGLVARRQEEGALFASQPSQGGNLTTILKNFPILNQRITIRSDGTRDINALYDCVAECIAMALQYFTGKAFHGGMLKEAAYGYNYVGGTAASAYVGYCAHFGVKLYPIDASAPTLIADIHQEIKSNHAAIITEPDRYLPPGSGWTHCIIMCEEGPGYLVANDPFIAAQITKKDSEWAQDLAVNEIWVLAPMKEAPMGITLAVPGISQYFKAGNGNEWVCSNGHTIHGAILTYYMTAFNLPLGGLTGLGLPLSEEVSMGDTAHPERVIQKFEYGTVQYNPQHIGGAQPGAGPVYTIRPELPVVTPPADVVALQAENAALRAKLDLVRKDAA